MVTTDHHKKKPKKPKNQKTEKPKNQKTEKPKNQKTKKTRYYTDDYSLPGSLNTRHEK